jgi:copper(I)-binding protein
MKKSLILLLVFLVSNLIVASEIEITGAKIRLVPPVSTTTAAFMLITNKSNSDLKLMKAEGTFAKTFELHEMKMENNKMQMRSLENILIKAHSTIELKSGSYHLMIFDLLKPVKLGENYKIKLTFDNKYSTEVAAIVE